MTGRAGLAKLAGGCLHGSRLPLPHGPGMAGSSKRRLTSQQAENRWGGFSAVSRAVGEVGTRQAGVREKVTWFGANDPPPMCPLSAQPWGLTNWRSLVKLGVRSKIALMLLALKNMYFFSLNPQMTILASKVSVFGTHKLQHPPVHSYVAATLAHCWSLTWPHRVKLTGEKNLKEACSQRSGTKRIFKRV